MDLKVVSQFCVHTRKEVALDTDLEEDLGHTLWTSFICETSFLSSRESYTQSYMNAKKP